MIEINEISKIAKLAKLSFHHQDLLELQRELSSIIQMIDILKEIDISFGNELIDLKNSFIDCNLSQRMRKDTVEIDSTSNDLFMNVPGVSANLARKLKSFIVPKMIK